MTATDRDTPPTFVAPGVLDAGDPDLDLDIDRATKRTDELDPLAMLAEIAEPVDMPDCIIPHRFRKGWAVRYSTVIDNDDVKRWQNRARVKGKRDEVDETRMACIVLANLCRALMRFDGAEWVEVPDPEGVDGAPLTFASRSVWQTYNAARAADAVRKFYGNDPYLTATLETVLRQAGVGDEVDALDPTKPSLD